MAQQKSEIMAKLRASAERAKLVEDRASVKEDIRLNGEIDAVKPDVSNIPVSDTSVN